MTTKLPRGLHAVLARNFPERRVFLRSDSDTRFIRLGPGTQLLATLGASVLIGWTIIATSVLVMDAIGAGNYRDQAQRDLETYEARLNSLAEERDARAKEAIAAQERFSSALAQISAMQSELLSSETRRRELETGLDVVQGTLRRTMAERETAKAQVTHITAALDSESLARAGDEDDGGTRPGDATIPMLSAALSETARARDASRAEAASAQREADDMAYELRLAQEHNTEIFDQIEDALTVTMEPLEKMFRKVGVDPDRLINSVRRNYSGTGGPLTPISFSSRGTAPTQEMMRAGRLLDRLDEVNLYRLAAHKVPLAMPVRGAFRYTSGYGMRWGRLHKGTDFAAARGTPIYTTADGVVSHAGWLSGYGQLIKIEHAMGIETRYAHLSRIRVREGQRVSRGDRIGDMGSTGRSTGTHLHYEVRVDGRAINPMTYIKAARDVF